MTPSSRNRGLPSHDCCQLCTAISIYPCRTHLVLVVDQRAQLRGSLGTSPTRDRDLVAYRAVVRALQDTVDLRRRVRDLVFLPSDRVHIHRSARPTSPCPGPSLVIRIKIPLLLGPGPTFTAAISICSAWTNPTLRTHARHLSRDLIHAHRLDTLLRAAIVRCRDGWVMRDLLALDISRQPRCDRS